MTFVCNYRASVRHEMAFTLIELLVSISIVGILAATSIPTFHEIKERAIASSLKQSALDARTAMEAAMADMENGDLNASSGGPVNGVSWSGALISYTFKAPNKNKVKSGPFLPGFVIQKGTAGSVKIQSCSIGKSCWDWTFKLQDCQSGITVLVTGKTTTTSNPPAITYHSSPVNGCGSSSSSGGPVTI